MITPTGIDDAYNKLSYYVAKYQMLTVMANYATDTGGYSTGGKSAIWNGEKNLIVSAESVEEALIIANKVDNRWTGRVIII